MAKIYFNLITAAPPQWSIDNVPARWKEDVQKMLSENEA